MARNDPLHAACGALSAYARNAYDDLPPRLLAIVQQARAALGELALVDAQDACPGCGNRDMDELVWVDGHVECARCRMRYHVAATPSPAQAAGARSGRRGSHS